MEVTKMLAELRAERARIEETILALERLGHGKKEAGLRSGWLKSLCCEFSDWVGG